MFDIRYSNLLCLGQDDKAHWVFQEKIFLSLALRLLWARERNASNERFAPASERRVYKGHDTKPVRLRSELALSLSNGAGCATGVAFVASREKGLTNHLKPRRIESIRHSMRQAKMLVPKKAFEFTQNSSMKTAFMIFPGPQQKEGTLEDLCLLTVENDPLLECVDDYLECAKAKGEQFPRIHKNKLHCFLAGKDDYAGSPISHAFKARVWPPDHLALEPFKRIIEEM